MSLLTPQFDLALCLRCGDCSLVCAQHAVTLPEDRIPRVDETACIYCGACEDACPVEAISLPLWIYTVPKE